MELVAPPVSLLTACPAAAPPPCGSSTGGSARRTARRCGPTVWSCSAGGGAAPADWVESDVSGTLPGSGDGRDDGVVAGTVVLVAETNEMGDGNCNGTQRSGPSRRCAGGVRERRGPGKPGVQLVEPSAAAGGGVSERRIGRAKGRAGSSTRWPSMGEEDTRVDPAPIGIGEEVTTSAVVGAPGIGDPGKRKGIGDTERPRLASELIIVPPQAPPRSSRPVVWFLHRAGLPPRSRASKLMTSGGPLRGRMLNRRRSRADTRVPQNVSHSLLSVGSSLRTPLCQTHSGASQAVRIARSSTTAYATH